MRALKPFFFLLHLIRKPASSWVDPPFFVMRNPWNFYLTTMSMMLSLCQLPSEGTNSNQKLPLAALTKVKINTSQISIHPGNLLTLADAEKIMGEPLFLTDTSTSQQAELLTYHCAYKAKAEDIKSKKIGAIYFLFENYDQSEPAHRKYTSIRTANEKNGINVLNDLGDEAYFHSDNENFYFIMVRKGSKIFTMKVNKITSTTSLDEFNNVAKKITDSL